MFAMELPFSWIASSEIDSEWIIDDLHKYGLAPRAQAGA
jgi:hypothetical protein